MPGIIYHVSGFLHSSISVNLLLLSIFFRVIYHLLLVDICLEAPCSTLVFKSHLFRNYTGFMPEDNLFSIFVLDLLVYVSVLVKHPFLEFFRAAHDALTIYVTIIAMHAIMVYAG